MNECGKDLHQFDRPASAVHEIPMDAKAEDVPRATGECVDDHISAAAIIDTLYPHPYQGYPGKLATRNAVSDPRLRPGGSCREMAILSDLCPGPNGETGDTRAPLACRGDVLSTGAYMQDQTDPVRYTRNAHVHSDDATSQKAWAAMAKYCPHSECHCHARHHSRCPHLVASRSVWPLPTFPRSWDHLRHRYPASRRQPGPRVCSWQVSTPLAAYNRQRSAPHV